MKLLKTNRSDGYVKLEVENEDDLWYLEQIIAPGDSVRALTQRTKIDGREKKTLKLTVRAEKIERQNNRLRVTGEIEKADEDVEHGYHTLNLEKKIQFEIWKDWGQTEWEKLQEAESHRSYKVFFCIMDKGEADFYLVKESGIEDVSNINENIPGKMYKDQDKGESFYTDIKSILDRTAPDVDAIILAGPGHEKQKMKAKLDGETDKKVFMQDTSVTGETGLREAIKRGALKKVVEDSRISDETDLLEEFYEELRKEGKAEYGEPVKQLAEQGAVETLLVTPEKFREERELVKKVEQGGGEVQTVHTDHEPGERLENLGGIAAILRYNPH